MRSLTLSYHGRLFHCSMVNSNLSAFCEERGHLAGNLFAVDCDMDFIVPNQTQTIKIACSDRRPLSINGAGLRMQFLAIGKGLFYAPANAFLHARLVLLRQVIFLFHCITINVRRHISPFDEVLGSLPEKVLQVLL